nr:MAG TPA: hypothetical protein [Caudoviricetes sp.]
MIYNVILDYIIRLGLGLHLHYYNLCPIDYQSVTKHEIDKESPVIPTEKSERG